jgi:nicotinamidase/pyrazinamidase
VVAPLNAWIGAFERERLVVVATRNWHPASHGSFLDQGGPWPPHCVAGTPGARFAPGLRLPAGVWLVSKATRSDRDAYSGFEGTDLGRRLKRLGAKRLFVGGLATDHGVVRTVVDSCRHGYETFVLADAIRAMDVHPGDGDEAEAAMIRAGASFVRLDDLLEEVPLNG